jgi:hypothetical protein
MTEKLPIIMWINEKSYIIELYENNEIDESNLLNLKEENDPFIFTNYTWYKIPHNYQKIIIDFELSVYANHYIILEYNEEYWITEYF